MLMKSRKWWPKRVDGWKWNNNRNISADTLGRLELFHEGVEETKRHIP